MSNQELGHTQTLELSYHIGNPNLCRVAPLRIIAMPECEGGGFAIHKDDAERIVTAVNERDDLLFKISQKNKALRPFAALGGPQDGFVPAYHDCPDDVVVYQNSGECITAGDVRKARIALGSIIDLKPAPKSEIPTWEELLWLAQQFRAGFDNKSLCVEYAEETWEHITRRLNAAVAGSLPAEAPDERASLLSQLRQKDAALRELKRQALLAPVKMTGGVFSSKNDDWLLGFQDGVQAKNDAIRDLAIEAALSPTPQHASDCAIHNEPALPKGDCSCGAVITLATEDYEILLGALEKTPENRPLAKLMRQKSVFEKHSPLPADDVVEAAAKAIYDLTPDRYGSSSASPKVEWRDASEASKNFKREQAMVVLAAANLLRQSAPVEAWKCKAKSCFGPEAQDCDWPVCGCDPHAEKVISALEEIRPASPPADVAGMRGKCMEACEIAAQHPPIKTNLRYDEGFKDGCTHCAAIISLIPEPKTDAAGLREKIVEIIDPDAADQEAAFSMADAILALLPTDPAVKALVEALEPFANEFYEDGVEIGLLAHREDNELIWIGQDLVAGDFRRAHATLAANGVK